MSKPKLCIAELLAQTALDHYTKLPNKGKPQLGQQWTVFSAIVATRKKHTDSGLDSWVVSCATGSKCATMHPALSHFGDHIPPCQGKGWGVCKEHCCTEQIKGFILHDSHAEVLARRGLMKVLWEEIIDHLQSKKVDDEEHRLLQVHYNDNKVTDDVASLTKTNISFELKKDIQLHLYISDSPCGDASIYEISQQYASNVNVDDNNSNGISFTGAKIIFPKDDKANNDNFSICNNNTPQNSVNEFEKKGQSSDTLIVREKVQIKSALRLKSGRSNIPDYLRSSSMCCSDKICKWIVTGLQGCGLLTAFIPLPIPVKSIVISKDPRLQGLDGTHQLEALERATVLRAKEVFSAIKAKLENELLYSNSSNLPALYICDAVFKQGKAMSEKEAMDDEYNSCNQQEIICNDTILHCNNQKRKIDNTVNRSRGSCKRLKRQKLSSCGLCLNWQNSHHAHNNGAIIEQVVGAKGVIQRKKPKCSDDIVKCASRLSRYSLWSQALQAFVLSKKINLDDLDIEHLYSYKDIKDTYSSDFIRLKLLDFILVDGKSALQGWVRNNNGDFFPHKNTKLSF